MGLADFAEQIGLQLYVIETLRHAQTIFKGRERLLHIALNFLNFAHVGQRLRFHLRIVQAHGQPQHIVVGIQRLIIARQFAIGAPHVELRL